MTELMGLDLRVQGKDPMVKLESVKSAVPTKEIILPKAQNRYPCPIKGRTT